MAFRPNRDVAIRVFQRPCNGSVCIIIDAAAHVAGCSTRQPLPTPGKPRKVSDPLPAQAIGRTGGQSGLGRRNNQQATRRVVSQLEWLVEAVAEPDMADLRASLPVPRLNAVGRRLNQWCADLRIDTTPLRPTLAALLTDATLSNAEQRRTTQVETRDLGYRYRLTSKIWNYGLELP
jgi:hypothetical protein